MAKNGGEPGLEPGTSRTLSGNHTSRPHALVISTCFLKGNNFVYIHIVLPICFGGSFTALGNRSLATRPLYPHPEKNHGGQVLVESG